MRRSVRCESRIPVAGLICPQIGKSMNIGLDHDEPFESLKVQCMNRYCKNWETMSIKSDKKNQLVQLVNNVPHTLDIVEYSLSRTQLII